MGTAWNRAYSTIKNPSIRYRFLIRSVSICNRDFFQFIILAEIRGTSAKEKLTPLIDFDDSEIYNKYSKKKKTIHNYYQLVAKPECHRNNYQALHRKKQVNPWKPRMPYRAILIAINP